MKRRQLILAGAALLSWQGAAGGIGWGALAIVGACLAWGADNNLTRKLSAADPVQIAMLKGLVAGAVNLALALWQVVVASGWRAEYILPSPFTVFDRLGELLADGTIADSHATADAARPWRQRARDLALHEIDGKASIRLPLASVEQGKKTR